MTKAFIFDMDGVIIASEVAWHRYLSEIWPQLIGPEIAAVYRVPIGQTPLSMYNEAVKHGSKVTQDVFLSEVEKIALKVYQEAPITSGMDQLGDFLSANQYKMGLVSSSKKNWIDSVVNRLSFKDKLQTIFSINDHPEIPPKPHPASYIQTIEQLGASSDTTIILEDSNSGIQAAKAAGVFTIGFTSNLPSEYTQHGADMYANTVDDIITIVQDYDAKIQALAHA